MTDYEAERANFRLEVPERFNFVLDVLERRAKETPDGLALLALDAGGGETARDSWAEMARESRRMGNALLGIEEGVPLEATPGQGGSEIQGMTPGIAGSELAPAASGQGGRAGATTVQMGSRPVLPSPAMGGSAGASPFDAGTQGGDGLPPGLTLVDELTMFTGRAFSHSLGLSGILTTTKAAIGVTIEPDCALNADCFAEASAGSFCVRGNVDPVIGNDFVNGWGLNLQLNLTGEGWDRSAGSVKGVSFKLSGTALPDMRFHATRPPTTTESYDNYCQELQPVDGQRVDALFDNLKVGCWDPAADDALPADAVVNTLAWQIDAVIGRSKPFDFCVSELRPIVAVE